jgi:hypothetical protein
MKNSTFPQTQNVLIVLNGIKLQLILSCMVFIALLIISAGIAYTPFKVTPSKQIKYTVKIPKGISLLSSNLQGLLNNKYSGVAIKIEIKTCLT